MGQKMRLALDFGPLLVFFLGYKFAGLAAATVLLIFATLTSLTIIYLKERRVAVMPLVSGICVTLFGGMTLWLHDDIFIKLKPTIVNLLFAGVLLGGLLFNKPMLKYLLGDALQLTERGWKQLSLRWGLFFIALAVLNEVIWRHYSTDFWVNFKVFGMFSLTMLFTLCQIPLIQKHWEEEKQE